MHKFQNGRSGSAIAVRVFSGSKKNEIDQILGDGTIKIKLTTPPVQGKANKALVKLLAEILDVNQSQIEIIAGEKSRNKLVTVYDLDAEIVNQRIQATLMKS
jgi:hypothetical protein